MKVTVKSQSIQSCLWLHEVLKPAGALFAMVAVVPRDKLSVTENADKLAIVDPAAAIQRYACKGCGVYVRPN